MSADRPSDHALWTSVEATIRNVVLPALTDEHARAAAIQLAGLSMYARGRGADPSADRRTEVAAALDSLHGNALVAPLWPGEPLVVAGSVLAAAVTRADPAAIEVRRVLRPLLIGFLDEDLSANAMLGGAFRGRLPDV